MSSRPFVSIVLTNSLAELERLALVLGRFANDHDLPAEIVFQFNLALDEIVTNVVEHGYDDTARHEIDVTLALDGAVMSATVVDDGVAFNPLDAPAPDLTLAIEDRPIGGLGVHFVRSVMDKVAYRRDGDRNVLTMTNSVAPAAQG